MNRWFDLEIYQLESFVHIIEQKSFSKAAKKMFVTQPTITNNIKNLEKELGTLLINRKGKSISLTESGQILYRHAKEVLNLRDQIVFDIGKHEGKLKGSVQIAASSIPEQYILPKVVGQLYQSHPGISFIIKRRDSKQVIQDLLVGDINCGIVGARYDHENLKYIELCDDQIVLVAPANQGFVLDNNAEVDINDIQKLNIIMREEGSGTRHILEKAFIEQGIAIETLNISSSIESNETIKKMIELGIGVSFLSKFAIEQELKLERLKAYDVKGLDLNRKFYFVYHKARHLSPMTEELKNICLTIKHQILL
jgi:DNA-binding transcriptional LysR family regulator